MPTPTQLDAQQKQADAGRLVSWLEGLERTEGWSKYLAPKIFTAYDAAVERIITAHAAGKAPEVTDISTLQGYHEIVTTVRRDQKSAYSTATRGPKPPSRLSS